MTQKTPPLPFAAEQALNSAPLGLMYVDEDNRVQWCNDQFGELMAIPAAEICGMAMDDLPLREPSLFSSVDFMTPLHAPQRRLRYERQPLAEGMLFYWLDVTPVLKSVKTRTLGLDGRETQEADTNLSIPGRQSTLRRLANEVARSRRYQNPLSVVHLNIAAVGNSASQQRQLVQLITESMRWVDFLGYWAADSLVLVLAETNLEDAENYRRKLQEQLLEAGLEVVTSSAEWQAGDDAWTLIQRAEPEQQAAQA